MSVLPLSPCKFRPESIVDKSNLSLAEKGPIESVFVFPLLASRVCCDSIIDCNGQSSLWLRKKK